MKKFLILILISGIIISTSFIFLHKKNNNLSTAKVNNSTKVVEKEQIESSKEENEAVDTNDEKLVEDQKEESKQNSDNSNDNKDYSQVNVVKEKVTNNTTNSTNSNQETKSQNNSQNITEQNTQNNQNSQSVPTVDGNAVNKNTIDYTTHKGRTDNCNSNSSCTEKGLNFYLRYKKVVANYFVLDVTANNGNILGYFIEYVFKEGEYDTEAECNSIGSSIKSELSDRVTGFRCSSRNNKYYLNITTDYD